jgi:RNA polymerase sigma-70 factor (ECF subfamily)
VDESTLITRSRAGDREAYDLLVGAYQDRIYHVAFRVTGNREDAWDAAQDAFIRAFQGLRSFRGEAGFGTWLHRIAVNAALDIVRRRPRTAPAGDDPPWTAGGDPAEEAVRSDVQRRVHAAISILPPEQRTAVVLRDLAGCSYEEVARILQIPIGTVRSRLSRGREALRARLADLAPTQAEEDR